MHGIPEWFMFLVGAIYYGMLVVPPVLVVLVFRWFVKRRNSTVSKRDIC